MVDEQDWLKLQIGSHGKPVDADAFVSIFLNTIAALKAIDRGFSTHGGETIQWEIIEVGSNSPIYATIRGREQALHNGQHGREITNVFVSGLQQLTKTKLVRPASEGTVLGMYKKSFPRPSCIA